MTVKWPWRTHDLIWHDVTWREKRCHIDARCTCTHWHAFALNMRVFHAVLPMLQLETRSSTQTPTHHGKALLTQHKHSIDFHYCHDVMLVANTYQRLVSSTQDVAFCRSYPLLFSLSCDIFCTIYWFSIFLLRLCLDLGPVHVAREEEARWRRHALEIRCGQKTQFWPTSTRENNTIFSLISVLPLISAPSLFMIVNYNNLE